MNDKKQNDQLEVHDEIDEFLEAGPGSEAEISDTPYTDGLREQLEKDGVIEKASEDRKIREAMISKEKALEADMVRLNKLDIERADNQNGLDKIQSEVDGFIEAEGLGDQYNELMVTKKSLKKDYDLLKEDIGKRGLEIHEKTQNTDPAPGVKLKKHDREELVVDYEEATKWAVDNGHHTLVCILEIDYLNVLKTGVLQGQPGKIDDTPEYKASISLKPYQEEK